MTSRLEASDIASEELRSFVSQADFDAWSELKPFFDEFFDLFEAREDGRSLSAFMASDDFSFFVNEAAAAKYLPDLLAVCGRSDWQSRPVALRSSVVSGREFKDEIRWSNRFFTSFEDNELGEWLSPNGTMPQGKTLFRARIQNDPEKSYRTSEMGCPPAKVVSNGRANPAGIPYLYLAEDPMTTLYEVRALLNDRVSIGTFELIEDVKVVDFTSRPDLYYYFSVDEGASSMADIVRKMLTFNAMADDLSRPVRSRDNSDVEYTPTQAVCEYCKQNGAGGIRFKSALNRIGVNVVLFDPDRAVCRSVTPVEVTKMELDCVEVPQEDGGAS